MFLGLDRTPDDFINVVMYSHVISKLLIVGNPIKCASCIFWWECVTNLPSAM